MVNTVLSKIPEQMIAWNSYWKVKINQRVALGFFCSFFFFGGGGGRSVLILSSTDYSHTYG